MQGLRKAWCSGTETGLHRRTTRAAPISLLRAFQYARDPAHFRCEPSHISFRAKKDENRPKLEETLLPAEPEEVLEANGLWSCVQAKWNKRWLCTVMCCRPRHIVACVLGDHSEPSCRKLWEQIPPAYRGCQSYSDFWEAYPLVFPAETYACVGKGSGQTHHMERWYCTLRQSGARFVRKTLSFSKSDTMHEIVTRLFIIRYYLSCVT